MIDLSTLDRPPAGFAACGRCAYRDTGTAAICFACASEHVEPIGGNTCDVCEQRLKPDGTCGNPLCEWDDRSFEWIWAISMRSGQMKMAIDRYKYDGRRGWAAIFGRILAGFLNDNRQVFSTYDLIVPSPSYVGPGAQRGFHHIEELVRAAEVEEPVRWPFAYGAIVKTRATEPFVGRGWKERKAIAEGPLRDALAVPDPRRVAGKDVLVIDDVFTEGFTIREVARALRQAGAGEVSEVVLAREPWKGD